MPKYRPLNSIDTLRNREYIYNHNIKTSLINSKFFRSNEIYCKNLFAHYGCVNALEFSNDGEWFASGGDDRRVLLWNVERNIVTDKNSPAVMSGRHASNIFCLAFDSNNTKIFSAGNDEQVIIHDTKTGTSLDVFPHYEAIYSLAIDPLDDNIFATACDDEVLVWDTRQSSESMVLACCNSSFHAVVYNPVDTRILATANSNEGIGLWDVRQPCCPLFKFSDTSPCQSSMSVKFSSNGRLILSLRRRLPVGLFSLTSPFPVYEFDHPGYYNSCTMKSCCFAGENDEYIMSGSDDFNLYMWRIPQMSDSCAKTTWVNEAHTIFRGHRSIVNQVRYNSSRSLIASSGVEKIIKLWSPFPIPEFEPQPSSEPRQVFSQNDYINMVRETGQYVTHDYSMQSMVEDPRMMAFFDSMVQRDVEGWSSPSTTPSFCRLSQDSLGEFSSSDCTDPLEEEDRMSFEYLAQLSKQVEDRLDTIQSEESQQQPVKEKILNLITKKKYQQVFKTTLLSYKTSKRKYKESKKARARYDVLRSARRVCLLYRDKFSKPPSRNKKRTLLIRRLDRLSSAVLTDQETTTSSRPTLRSALRELSDSIRVNNHRDSSSSSTSSSEHPPVAGRRKRPASSPSPSFKKVSKLQSRRNYRRRDGGETSSQPRSSRSQQLSESDTDVDMLACNNNNNGASKHKSIKDKFWGSLKKSLRRRRRRKKRLCNGNRAKRPHTLDTSSTDSKDSEGSDEDDRLSSVMIDDATPSTSRQRVIIRIIRRDPVAESSSSENSPPHSSPPREEARTDPPTRLSSLMRARSFHNLRAADPSSDTSD